MRVHAVYFTWPTLRDSVARFCNHDQTFERRMALMSRDGKERNGEPTEPQGGGSVRPPWGLSSRRMPSAGVLTTTWPSTTSGPAPFGATTASRGPEHCGLGAPGLPGRPSGGGFSERVVPGVSEADFCRTKKKNAEKRHSALIGRQTGLQVGFG